MEPASRLIGPKDLNLVRMAPVFRDLVPEAVERLVSNATVRRVARSNLLFNQGDPADRFFVVLEGKVKLFTAMENGDEGVVEVIEPISSFAEAAMFGSGRFPVNAEVVDASRLVQIPAEPFLRQLADNPSLTFKILATMSRRHRRLLHQITDLKVKSPGQRLGTFLLSLTDADNGSAKVTLPFDKTLIASHVGMKPESLSRAMARLREIGVVCSRRDVTIHDIRSLRRFCGEDEAETPICD